MKRTFNYTNRKRIDRKNVDIKMIDLSDGRKSFTMNLKIDDLDLPLNGKIYVEAYRSNIHQRFSFGKVGNISDKVNILSNFPLGSPVLFRVLVVDSASKKGLILASVDQVSADDQQSGNKVSLLPIKFVQNLGQELWQINFIRERPYLLMNAKIPNIKDRIKNDAEIFSLIFPQAVRQVLFHILVVNEYHPLNFDYQENEFYGYWIQFAIQINTSELEEDATVFDKVQWINETISKFCIKLKTYTKYIDRYRGRI